MKLPRMLRALAGLPSCRATRARGGLLRVIAPAAISVSIALTPSVARANDPVAADALFQAAKQLMADKQFAEACPKFDASYKLDPTLGTLLNLADCYEKLGRIATAWSTWGEAMEKAQRDGDKRAEFARQRREALSPRLPKVIINVQNEVAGVDIIWDQGKLASAVFGVELPADPAEHDLVVLRDDGTKLKEERVRITTEGSKTEVTLDIEALDKANPRKVEPKEGPTVPVQPTRSSQRLAGFVVGGLGVGALVAAGVLEGVALLQKGEANAPGACVNKFCTPSGLESISTATTLAEAGQWIGVGGIVAFAVGATLLFTAPTSAAPPAKASLIVPRSTWIAPWASGRGGGLVIGGAL